MKITSKELLTIAIEETTDSAWDVASDTIWKDYPFSPSEVRDIKKQIRRHFEKLTLDDIPFFTGVRELLEFIARIELTARYLKRKPGRWIPHPVIWFNPNNPHGYVGTKKWYDELKEMKKYLNVKFTIENGQITKTAG